MADNVTITAGTGTTVAADDIGGVLHQRVKISVGADGVGADVSSSAPMPVTLANTGANATPVSTTALAATRPTGTTMQSGAVANGNGTNLAVTGYGTALLSITASVTMSGGTTINFEASTDDTTFVPIQAQLLGTNTVAVSTTTTGDYRLDCSGFKSIRARISAWSAGTISILGYVLASPPSTIAVNANLAPGTNNIGDVDVLTMPQPAPPSSLISFVTAVTTAGTRVQLASNVGNGFVLQAPSTNTGLIYVGGSTVSSTVYGAELQPGQSTGLAIDNTNKVYVDSSVNGDKCAVLGS